ncbi:flagellar motor switch protein FliG [bacterium DOLZORAL124_64_63]|nr:MAG: flagellar motor switch protein FliG [bacterium DOLZORAL124_64_63]
MEVKDLPGPLKAAILIQCLEPGLAGRIKNGLEEPDRAILDERLQQLGSIAPELREKVAREFLHRLTGAPPGPPMALAGSSGTAPTAALGLESAAGPGFAPAPSPVPAAGAAPRSVVSPPETAGRETPEGGDPPPGFALLRSEPPEELARLIKDEHPQTIAVILTHLPAQKAGDTLVLLPGDIKADVAARVALAGKYSPEMVDEINRVFLDILKKKSRSTEQTSGSAGLARLAEMFNLMEKDESDALLAEIEVENPVLAARVRQIMFVFDDILLVDDRGLQQVLRKVDTREMAVALKASSDEIRAKIYQNMSERAGAMLREEMETLGPVRMRDVELSQQTIINIIQEMESDGALIIQRGGNTGFVE